MDFSNNVMPMVNYQDGITFLYLGFFPPHLSINSTERKKSTW